MRLSIRASSAAFSVMTLAACAQFPGRVPSLVDEALASLAETCREAGGRPRMDDAVRQADLNADLRPELVVFAGWARCEGAASVYGDREKRVAVYVTYDDGGAVEAFSDTVYDANIETAGGTAQVWLSVAGEQCGRAPAPDFASESFCDRAIVWSPAAARFVYAPISTVRMVE